MHKVLGFLILLISTGSFAAVVETTASGRYVDKILIREATTADYYIKTTHPDGWGAPSCSNADYVIIQSHITLKESMLSAALTAKTAGLSLVFKGECATNSNHFIGEYLILQ